MLEKQQTGVADKQGAAHLIYIPAHRLPDVHAWVLRGNDTLRMLCQQALVNLLQARLGLVQRQALQHSCHELWICCCALLKLPLYAFFKLNQLLVGLPCAKRKQGMLWGSLQHYRLCTPTEPSSGQTGFTTSLFPEQC